MPDIIAVTGCASGIGAQTAKVLRAEGARVIGLDIVEAREDVDEFIPLDLTDPTSIDAAAAALPDGLAGLANIAGLPPREGWEAKILQVNYHGQRQLTGAALNKLVQGAAIVNLASRAGKAWMDNIDQVKRLTATDDLVTFSADEGLDPARAYNLSKEAMIVWTLAESEGLVARGLRMNCVSPSAVATGILDDFLTAFGPMVAKNVERAGRAGTAEEIARIVTFLLNPASGWIRGTDIWTDGGMGAFAVSDMLNLAQIKCL